MKSKEEKGGTPSPLTLKQYLDGKAELLVEELTDIQDELLSDGFDKETRQELNDRSIECRSQLNLIREIKTICNNRGRY